MLDEKFLTDLVGNEEVSAEDIIKQILGEHEADTRGLLAKRDELLGSQKKLKEEIEGYKKGYEEYDSKIKGLEEMLEKANNGDQKAKEFYETKLSDLQKQYESQLSEATEARDYYLGLHLSSLRDRAIEDATKDLNFVTGLKQGFIARVLSQNDFEPEEIDGQLVFLNKDHHTIEEAINSFALTQEGKAYIANPSTGGGARGSGVGTGTYADSKVVSRKQFDNMSPQAQSDFVLKGGTITD